MTAADLLGQSHPLTRASRRFETACLQLLSGITIFVAIGVFAHGPARLPEFAVAIATCSVLAILVASAWCRRRRCALEVIMRGDEDLPLDELEPVRRRLEDPKGRARMASSLERCLHSARRWNQTPPQLRPVANVRLLLRFEDEVREIARLLRAETVPRVRGVALCESLLTDGVSSPLFRTEDDALRRELWRIRFALDAR